jgi:hypothetical protein
MKTAAAIVQPGHNSISYKIKHLKSGQTINEVSNGAQFLL